MGSYQSESRYYFHVQLLDIEPPIWRSIIVPGAISLHTLHKMLQVTMGWENAHLYLFRLTMNQKTTTYGLPHPDWDDAGLRIRESRRTKLDATVWTEWLDLTYEYDLGDSWMHQITIERIEHKVYAFNACSGSQKWICPAGENMFYATPVVVNNTVYMAPVADQTERNARHAQHFPGQDAPERQTPLDRSKGSISLRRSLPGGDHQKRFPKKVDPGEP
jgi:hypothetical protein